MIATHNKMQIDHIITITRHKTQSEKKMLITGKSAISSKCSLSSLHLVKKTGNTSYATIAKAKKSDNSSTKQNPIFPIKFSTKFLAQSAVAVFGLGFIDAGYSGDWSRIGAITKESEDMLKVAAFFVVPICIFLVVYLANSEELSS